MPGWSIPTEFPLSKLVGQEVTQVCIGLGVVTVHLYRQPQPGTPDKWESGARMDIESAYTLEVNGFAPNTVAPEDFKITGGQLAGLLGESVTEVERRQGNQLRVAFTNACALILHTDPHGFESYHLHVAGESVTVTKA
jgi:hypothetical protein